MVNRMNSSFQKQMVIQLPLIEKQQQHLVPPIFYFKLQNETKQVAELVCYLVDHIARGDIHMDIIACTTEKPLQKKGKHH